MGFDNVVLSPGPGTPTTPSDLGICADALRDVTVPTLGVCLGHQAIGHVYGARVRHAPEPMHGRISAVLHDGRDLFEGVPQRFEAVRYHSLLLDPELPSCLEKTAWTEDGLVMGVVHRTLPLWGVQFHPESIRTEFGIRILQNFRRLTLRHARSCVASRRESRRSPIAHASPSPSPLVLRSRRLALFADPEDVFVAIYGGAASAFWLDGNGALGALRRFSFMGDGTGPHAEHVTYRAETREVTVRSGERETRFHESLYDYLERELEARRTPATDLPFDFQGGYVGYFGYELNAEMTRGPTRSWEQPEASLLFADRIVAFDHDARETQLVCIVAPGKEADGDGWLDEMTAKLEGLAATPPPRRAALCPARPPRRVSFRLERSRAQYLADIARCQERIRDGETYEVCLTNRIHTSVDDPLAFYRALRRINPAPYAAFLRLGEVCVASSSPERFLRVERDGSVESRPIKGTRPRGGTPEADDALKRDLGRSEKDLAENLMIVDLLRNDLGMVCDVGSVHVPAMMHVETYATVHQLVSTVRGRLRAGVSAVACLRSAFPGGSMTGAPKLRTMRILEELEPTPRGVYSGAIGYLSLGGTADLSIVIRSLVKTPSSTTIGVGGAIVALSNADDEFEEMLVKARALIHAAACAERGESEPVALVACEGAIGALRETGAATV
jgi:para-aminobenzoate synthetase